MTRELGVGTYIVDGGTLMRVAEVHATFVTFEDHSTLPIKDAQERIVPVQPGDMVRPLEGGEPVRVTEITESLFPGVILARYEHPKYGEIAGEITEVADRLVFTSHFETGSRVRFRNTVTYTVTDWDGELHELVPDDGSETLHFSPDFFELVSPPPVPEGTAARHNDTGTNALVRWANANEVSLMAVGNTVGVSRIEFVVSRIEFEADYTIL